LRELSRVADKIIRRHGDATALTEVVDPGSLSVVVFHQALHHIAMDKDTASTEFGRILIAAGEGPEQNDFFHIEVLHHVIAQAKQVLRPHGRIVIVSPKWPGMYRDGKPLLMGWNFDDMLRDNDFVGVEIFEGENRLWSPL
jgi:hypothetical protein